MKKFREEHLADDEHRRDKQERSKPSLDSGEGPARKSMQEHLEAVLSDIIRSKDAERSVLRNRIEACLVEERIVAIGERVENRDDTQAEGEIETARKPMNLHSEYMSIEEKKCREEKNKKIHRVRADPRCDASLVNRLEKKMEREVEEAADDKSAHRQVRYVHQLFRSSVLRKFFKLEPRAEEGGEDTGSAEPERDDDMGQPETVVEDSQGKNGVEEENERARTPFIASIHPASFKGIRYRIGEERTESEKRNYR